MLELLQASQHSGPRPLHAPIWRLNLVARCACTGLMSLLLTTRLVKTDASSFRASDWMPQKDLFPTCRVY